MDIEIRRIGNSAGIILPKELLARLRLEPGDKLVVTEGPDRTLSLSPYSEDDSETMEIARKLMRDYAETFWALAK